MWCFSNHHLLLNKTIAAAVLPLTAVVGNGENNSSNSFLNSRWGLVLAAARAASAEPANSINRNI